MIYDWMCPFCGGTWQHRSECDLMTERAVTILLRYPKLWDVLDDGRS